MNWKKTLWATALSLSLLAPSSAFAHKFKLFALVEGDMIEGYGYFGGGLRPKGAPVAIMDSQGTVIATVPSNDDGAFSYKPAFRQDLTVQMDVGDGHVARFLIEADELPSDLPLPDGTAMSPSQKAVVAQALTARAGASATTIDKEEIAKLVSKAVGKQIRPLREQIESFEEKIRLHDILGGIGYILGLMGLTAYLAARKKEKALGK